jgi:hypothetical protein
MPAVTARQKAANRSTGFTAEERAAMRERVKEMKASAMASEGEADVIAKIAEMPEPDRSMAKRIHALVKEAAPGLTTRTWYGMPAYARDGKIVCFFKGKYKFNVRYATFGFSDEAHLDEGSMWPDSYALTKLTSADEARITALVKQAVG